MREGRCFLLSLQRTLLLHAMGPNGVRHVPSVRLSVLLWKGIRTGLELLVMLGRSLHLVVIAGHYSVAENSVQFCSCGPG